MERTVDFGKRCIQRLLTMPKTGPESPQGGIQNPPRSARGWGVDPRLRGDDEGGAGMTKGARPYR